MLMTYSLVIVTVMHVTTVLASITRSSVSLRYKIRKQPPRLCAFALKNNYTNFLRLTINAINAEVTIPVTGANISELMM